MRNFYPLLFSLMLFCFPIFSYSAPAYPGLIEFTQPDGSKITIRLKGDENARWAETKDGYSILFNAKGFYEYANQDESGDMVCSGIIAKDVEKRSSVEEKFLSRVSKQLKFSKSQVNQIKSIQQIYKAESQESFPKTGSRKLVCILIGFTDVAFTKTKADFQNLFNQVGYNFDGATGSVKDFYLENSYGLFNLTVSVAGPYTASNNMAYYGGKDVANGNKDIRRRELITEAVQKADPDLNYADFDNDNDGSVDGVYVIYGGYGEEAGASSDAIWAHAWAISPLTLDGKSVSRYSCSSELRGNTGTGITRIGVICHEFGHVLGAPDYYDTDYETGGEFDGTGYWDLMASGSWNNNGATPAHHNAYTKTIIYNWATPVIVSSPATISAMPAAATSPSGFYIINTATSNEFFICENRQKVGFDAGLPGHGLIIYHKSNDGVSNDTYPQNFYPVCASATSNPGSTAASYGNINTGGCPFPGTYNKTSFTDETVPCARSWAGDNTNMPITSITENTSSKTISFVIGDSDNPKNFTASAMGSSRIDLSWAKNVNNDNVLIAYSTTNTIGVPANGSTYGVGNSIPGGGTVIYSGSGTSFSHSSLSAATRYYYKAWSVKTGSNYSAGISTSGLTSCGSVSLPYAENFESGSVPPSCWTSFRGDNGLGTQNDWSSNLTGYNGSSGAAYLRFENVTGGLAEDWLVSPQMTIPAGTSYTLSFYERQDLNGDFGSQYYVKISTSSQNNKSSFVNVASYNESSFGTTYSKRTVDLSAYAGQNIYIAFVMVQDDGDSWFIDNVDVSSICNPVIAVSPLSVTASMNTNLASTKSLAISNTGCSALNWQLVVDSASLVGDWTLTFRWGCGASYASTVITFKMDGTFSVEDNIGIWTRTGDQVEWTYPSGTKYTGTISNNTMSGTMVSFSGSTGCWSATRNAAASSVMLKTAEFSSDGRIEKEQNVSYEYKPEPILEAFPGWLTVSPMSGTISAGSTQNLNLDFCSTGLRAGGYSANIKISSNDPAQPEVLVLVQLQVTESIVLPTVVTNAVTNVSSTTATCGGNVTDEGGSVVTIKGICWGTSANPTISNTKTINGSGTGTFQSNISNLTVNTTYHVRAYAINSAGTAYGADVSFTTTNLPAVPVLSLPTNQAVDQSLAPTLTWLSSVNATGYSIQVSTSAGFETTITNQTGLATTSVNLTGLTANTTYYWRVKATNNFGTSAWSTVFSFTTVGPPAIPVLSLPANGAAGQSITPALSWLASNLATSYSVQVSVSSDFGTTIVNQTGLPSTNCNLTGLTANTIYYWRVNASNNYGTSGWSSVFSFTTMAPPIAPMLSLPSDGATDQSLTPTLSWLSSDMATSYSVQVSVSPVFATTVVSQSGLTWTSHNLSGLTANTTYYWRVNATNSLGTSAWSTVYSFSTAIPPSAPTLALPANGSVIQGVDPTLSWVASNGATSYSIQISTSQSFGTTVLNQTGRTGTSISASGFANNTTYYWRVSACNAGGSSAWSPVFSFTIAVPPSVPVLLFPSNGAVDQSVQPNLRWSASNGATGYSVQVSASYEFTTTIVDRVGITSDNTTLSGLTGSTTYYWRVKASNMGGSNGWSSVFSFTTLNTMIPPTLSSPANGTVVKSLSPNFNWAPANEATGYEIQVSTTADFGTLVNQSVVNSATFTGNGLFNNNTYFWRVRSTKGSILSAWSDIWMFSTSLNIGFEELEEASFSIFPNPTSGMIRISCRKEIENTIGVYSADGILLITKVAKEKDITIDLGDLPQGFYTVKISNKDGLVTHKLIKR